MARLDLKIAITFFNKRNKNNLCKYNSFKKIKNVSFFEVSNIRQGSKIKKKLIGCFIQKRSSWVYPNCRKGVPKNDGSSNPVFDAMLLAAIFFGGKERKKTEDFVSETQLLLV